MYNMQGMITCILLFLAIFMISFLSTELDFVVYAQNASPINVTLDQTEFIKIILSAGLVSAVLSTLLTHYFSIRSMKKEMQIKKKEDTKKFYGEIKSHLDRMTTNPEFTNNTESKEKLESTIESIDLILIPNYYLASDPIQKKWWDVRQSFKNAKVRNNYSSTRNDNNFEKFKTKVQEMVTLLGAELSKP
jgi:hypothetical protein